MISSMIDKYFKLRDDQQLFYCPMKKEMFDTIDGRVLRSFQIVKKIGQGAYGQVWKARNKKTGSTCALKKIYEAFRNSSDAQKAYRQIKYLQKLDHPSIIKLISIHQPYSSRDIYLQLQFMQADLCVALKNSVLKEIHKHYIFYQLVNAVNYLHSADLIHRDIKPSNILVNQTCQMKLCDFGLIRSLKKDLGSEEAQLTQNIATRWYRAPQILLCSNNYGKPIDVWSLGCVLAEMIMQRPIFQGSSTLSQLQKIFQVTGKPTSEDLSYLKSKSSLLIIENMQIKQRKTIKELLNTNDKNIIDLLQRIFQVNPKKRPTASQLLSHPFITKFKGKVEQKVASKPIKILYEVKQLGIEDYKKLVYGEVDQKDFKINQNIVTPEQYIYKTVPNGIGRKNIIDNYPWAKPNDKSPNLNQKISPLGFRCKQRPDASKDKIGSISKDKIMNVSKGKQQDISKDKTSNASKDNKKQRHSPSFLQNRKKTPNNRIQQPGTIDHANKLIKKWSFPLSNKASNTPDKSEHCSRKEGRQMVKVQSQANLQKFNPQKATQQRPLQTIHQYKYSQECNQTTEASIYFKTLNTTQNEISKSKEKPQPPKFLQTNIKDKYEPSSLLAGRSPVKNLSPLSKPYTFTQMHPLSPNNSKVHLPYQISSFGKVMK